MTTKEFMKKLLVTGALIYTAISACSLIISALIMGDSESVTEAGGQFINLTTHIFMLVFAYFASLGVCISSLESVPSSAKPFIEGFGYIGGFFFFLVLPLKRGFTGSIMLTVSFALVYIIVKVLIGIITYDENQGRTKPVHNKKKKGGANRPSVKSAKPEAEKAKIDKVKPEKVKTVKPQKMKDEEYTSLFTSNSDK